MQDLELRLVARVLRVTLEAQVPQARQETQAQRAAQVQVEL